jgi:hypothetical protein
MFRYSNHAALLFACALPLAAFADNDSVDRKVAASADGEVVISNVSGTIDVRGWDRNEVQVTGHLGEGVERLDVETSGGRVVVKVVLPRGKSHDGDADIEVSVPRNSSVEVSAVSADVSSRGVLGTQRLKSVSGEVTADIAGDESEVRSVSGDVTVRGSGKPVRLRVSSVSGNLDLTNAAGSLDLVTVSGDASVQMGDTSDVRGVSVPLGITTPAEPNIASTIWRSAADQKNLTYMFDSATRPNVFWVSLSQLNLKAGAPSLKLPLAGGEIYGGEVAAKFVPTPPFAFLPAG